MAGPRNVIARRGHLFIVRGDLTRLACDAWLLPCDSRLNVSGAHWCAVDERLIPSPSPDHDQWYRLLQGDPPAEWFEHRTYPAVAADGVRPTPWLTDTARRSNLLTQYFAELRTALMNFLVTATAALNDTPPMNGRARHLLAVPFVGSGAGGGSKDKADLTRAVLEVLRGFVDDHDVDVALVMDDDQSYAAAQWVRREMVGTAIAQEWTVTTDPGVDPELLLAEADRLAEHLRNQTLVLFVGAGLSTSAGLPDWGSLLEELAIAAALQVDMPSTALEPLRNEQFTDQAEILERLVDRTGASGRAALERFLAQRLRSSYIGLGHALLASLGVDEIVTTNYDNLIEIAETGAGRAITVLPTPERSHPSRWLLKLHGSIDQPGSIVLTRSDYLRYDDQRGALAGLVQAMLITRHVLFVGYSLRDEDFHRIVDGVRKAMTFAGTDAASTVANRLLGTSLHLYGIPLMDLLWGDDIDTIAPLRDRPQGAGAEFANAIAEAARRCEVFLDLLAHKGTDHLAHLLDDTYDALDDDADGLREVLRSLALNPAVQTEAAEPIRAMLRRYGWNG